jgi:hypothetical protein
MRLYIDLPIPLAERVRERAEQEMRPIRWEVIWLINFALQRLEDEEAAHRPALRGGEAAAGPAEHQPQLGGETDAPTTP